jgi:tetratricopeptide (TPR) repeat protein
MSNWRQQNAQAKAAILTCLETLGGRGVVWITCDSEAHAADTLTWLQGQFLPGEHPYGYFPFSGGRPMLVSMLDEWKTFAVDGVDPAPILHWRGLGFYTEQVYTKPMPGYYEELNLAAVLPGAGLPFTAVLWTDGKTRDLIQAGAPAFAEAITLHVHLDHPPIDVARELEVMAEEFDQLDETASFALATYQAMILDRLLPGVTDPKLARQTMEYGSKLCLLSEQYADAISLLDECMRMPLPLTPVKKADYQFTIGICHKNLGAYANATRALKASLATHRQVKDEAKEVICLSSLGEVALAEMTPHKAVAYLEEALDIALGIEDFSEPTIKVFLQLGEALEMVKDYPAALATYDLYFEEELQLEYPEGDAQVTLAKALLLEQTADQAAMMETLEAAYLRLKTGPDNWLPGSQSVLHFFGCQLHEAGDMVRAVNVLLEAVLQALQAREFDLALQAYAMISMCYISLGMEEEAVRYYLRSLKWMDEKGEEVKEQLALLHKELVDTWGKERVAQRIDEILPVLYGDEEASGAAPVTASH